jgi:hypothetical protein
MSIIDNNPKPVVAVDFDATLCHSNYPACGDPIPGGKEALERFRQLGYLILIFSCRTCHWHYGLYPNVKRGEPVMEREAVVNMKNWLIEHEIPFDEIDEGTRGKPDYTYLVDDKAIRFQDNWAEISAFVEARTKH